MKYDEEKGRYRIVEGLEYGKPHHSQIAHILREQFPECHVFMYSPYDYGHSVFIVVEDAGGTPILFTRIEVVRHDLKEEKEDA